MALKDLITDLGSFYENNPFAAKYKSKAGPTYAQKSGFNQRSFRYGDDRPDGGSSKQPFVKSVLPDVNSDPTSATGLLAGITRQITARVDDLERIGKYLITPKGLQFIVKQQLLSAQNPIVPGKPNRFEPLKGFYNPLNTLAQVAASGTGLHLEKQGLLPIGFKDEEAKYEKEYRKLSKLDPKSGSNETSNRLENLYISKILLRSPNTENLKATGISTNPEFLLSYPGGPGITTTNIGFADSRVYGDGKPQQVTSTTGSLGEKIEYEKKYLELSTSGSNRLESLYTSKLIKTPTSRPQLTENQVKNTYISTNPTLLLSYPERPGGLEEIIYFADKNIYQGSATTNSGLSTYTLTQLNKQKSVWSPDAPDNLGLITGDFRGNIPYKTENATIGVFGKNVVNYLTGSVNKIQRVGIGDPGRRSRDRSNLYKSDFASVDKVAAMPLYKQKNVDTETGFTRDFIRFRFEVLDNSSTDHTFVHFRAFLGAITDNFGGQWNDSSFVGRGDRFHTYTGFTRDISLSFTVHPQSRDEMAATYQKLTYLASTLAPDYSGAGGYMKGNITRLTIGSYFYRIPGFISSLTYTVPEEASWEIAYNEPESGTEKDMLETPRHFDISLNFTPIHDFAPQLMDGTRKYALFTPQEKFGSGKFSQYNPFIPLSGQGNILNTNSIEAGNKVSSIPTSIITPST